MHTDELTGVVTPAFDPVSLSAKVYDQTIATLAITVACGLVTGVAMQRHLINGVGCFSATLFFGWLALVAIFALPLLIYANVRSVFNEDEANKDCASFPDTGYDFSKTACEARFWTFISGGVLVLVTLVVMTIFGLIEAMGNILKTSNKALVRIKKFRGFHPIMRAGGPGAGVTVAPYDDQSEVQQGAARRLPQRRRAVFQLQDVGGERRRRRQQAAVRAAHPARRAGRDGDAGVAALSGARASAPSDEWVGRKSVWLCIASGRGFAETLRPTGVGG